MKTLRWDGTVTAGNVLTAASLILALVVWGLRLEGRVDLAHERQSRFETITTQARQEDREVAAMERSEVRTSLRRIEDYLLRITPGQGSR